MRRLLLLGLALAAGAAQPASGREPSLAPWVGDARFMPVFDMYWRARLLHSYAGSRLCALPDRPKSDDPKSPFRALHQRLFAAAARIELRWPRALNDVARPYQMAPPQSLCEDERPAWEALFALETAIVALERLLDDVERGEHSGEQGQP